MKVKVIENTTGIGWLIVLPEYGETRRDQSGRAYSYEPLPLARIPAGYGRTIEEARVLADQIAAAMEAI